MISEQLNCTGDAVVCDIVTFTEGVFGGSYRRPKYQGNRTIVARVVNDSYGAEKQHTFSLVVLESSGVDLLEVGEKVRRKGRNVYRHGTTRMPWADEAARRATADEKHSRRDRAREARAPESRNARRAGDQSAARRRAATTIDARRSGLASVSAPSARPFAAVEHCDGVVSCPRPWPHAKF